MLFVDARNPKPLHDQIKDSILSQITFGVLAPGAKLPSVREMSQKEGIAPNTIQRAYRELDEIGAIVSFPARGSFVADGASELVRKRRIHGLFSELNALLGELRRLGVTEDELQVCLKGGLHTHE